MVAGGRSGCVVGRGGRRLNFAAGGFGGVVVGGRRGILGFVWQNHFFRLLEEVEAARILAIVTGVIAIEEVEDAGLVSQFAEGDGGASGGGAIGEILLFDFEAPGFAFDGPDARLAPERDGHFFEEGLLGGSFGLKFGVEGGEELGEDVGVFVVEDDGSGEDAVANGVLRGAEFAFGSFRAAGIGAIEARGEDLFFGAHGVLVLSMEDGRTGARAGNAEVGRLQRDAGNGRFVTGRGRICVRGFARCAAAYPGLADR